MVINYSIKKGFSKTPGPRLKSEGEHSAEECRERLYKELKLWVKKPYVFSIDLDGTAGYAGSFLEEVFGGLVRNHAIDGYQLLNFFTFKSNEESHLISDIIQYIVDAMNVANGEMITIKKEKYNYLIENSDKLNALEQTGVDNWEGYGIAIDLYNEWNLISEKTEEGLEK